MAYLRKAKIALVILFGTGVILRLLFFLANRSLWLDELFIAFNAKEVSFLKLLSPLAYQQCAPIGFIAYEKLFMLCLGNTEYALRLFPLLCGLAGIGYFWVLAKRLNTSYSSAVIALALFAFSKPLIYFSAEAKQYSSDVLITILLFLLFIQHTEIESKREANNFLYFSFWVSGVITIMLSQTAIFTITGFTLILMLRYYKQRETKKFISLGVAYFIWILISYVLYSRIYYANFVNPYLQDFWKGSFINFSSSPFEIIKLLFQNIVGISYGAGELILGTVLLVTGSLFLFRRKKYRLLILVSPLIVCIFVSAFKHYPIEERLLLFLTPSAIIIAAEGIDFYRTMLARRSAILAYFFLGLIILLPLGKSLELIINPSESTSPRPRQESKPVINYIAEHVQTGDLIYAFADARYALKYYARPPDINKYLFIEKSQGEPLEKTFEPLKNKKRVWILFTHFWRGEAESREKKEIAYLDSMGKRLDTYKKCGAEAYLYNFN